ncbi:MAG: abortive phage infection protein, partial [Tissierellia bacterium]|nr:abortive phage infection protein [Tissierellia bacterium]
LTLGVIKKETNMGNLVKLYSAERTLCDFIKNRSDMDPEVYINFVKTYPSYPDRDIHQLFNIAQQMNIVKEVQEIMELVYE